MNSKQLSSLLLSMFLTLAYPFAHAEEGGSNGGGGDPIALEFSQALDSALAKIRKFPKNEENEALHSLIREIDFTALKAKSKLVVTDKVLKVKDPYSGDENAVMEVAAKNFPAKFEIQINRGKWKNIYNPQVKEGLALHEYLSLVERESTGTYFYSSEYLKKFNLNTDAFTSPEALHGLRLLQRVKIIKVECHEPGNISHEDTSSGSITVKERSGKVSKLQMVVSRWIDTKAEAKVFCAAMKAAQKRALVDIFFYEGDGDYQEARVISVGRAYGLETEAR